MVDPIGLARELIRFNTINPPGNERACAEHLGSLLRSEGFEVHLHDLGPHRANLIARAGGGGHAAPIALTGHLDTVPLGNEPWSADPLSGESLSGKLYGRGSSDMKGAIAAMTAAAVALVRDNRLRHGIELIFTAGEEQGCEGARQLTRSDVGEVSALMVGEPTGNRLGLGHKGALQMTARTRGVTAHSSMPHTGVNAIYKAAHAIRKVEALRFHDQDPLLGSPTINVGMVKGGLNVNSVADFAEFTVDVRSVVAHENEGILKFLRAELGEEVELAPFLDLPPVAADPDDAFVRLASDIVTEITRLPSPPLGLPFFTDASILTPMLRAPTIILGPGETEMAHKTDEFCYVKKINESMSLYTDIARRWDGR